MTKYVSMLIMLLLVLLPSLGFAQEYYTLSEIREEAKEGWNKTYIDKYGREMLVNIDVEVFGETVAPILKIGFPEYAEYIDKHNNPYETVTNVRKTGGQRTWVYNLFGPKIDLDKAYGAEYGNDLTPREMYEFLGELLDEQGIPVEDFIYDQPKEFDMLCNTSQATGEVLATAFYLVHLWPQMHGLPILTNAQRTFEKPGWPDYEPFLMFMMRNREEYSLGVMTLTEQEMVAEDIPLCSLKQVIKNIESEIEAGYIQDVRSLRFGYSVYNDPEIRSKAPVSAYDVECWYAVPSWVLGCKFMAKPKQSCDESTPIKYITINAQTGKMLDPFDKSKYGVGNSDYKGFISWKDVE